MRAWLFSLACLLAIPQFLTGQDALPRFVQTIPLPGVRGRIDHMDVDVQRQRLFIGALENDSLEIVDLKTGTTQSLPHLGGPQGVAFIPSTNEVWVACRDTGNLVMLDGATLKEKKRLAFGNEADNLHLAGPDLVVLGYGNGGVAFLDPRSDLLVSTVELGGHPEGLAPQFSCNRVLVNVPERHSLFALDLSRRTVLNQWSPEGLWSNFPLAVEQRKARGAYFTHVPSQITLFETETGKVLSRTASPGDVDDLFFDEDSSLLYLVSGDGKLEVWSLASAVPRVLGFVTTGPGARTGLLSLELKRFFVAAPDRGNGAHVLVFETRSPGGGS